MTPVTKVPDRVQDTTAELNGFQPRVDVTIGITTSQFATRSQRLCLMPRAEKATSPKIGSTMNSPMKLTYQRKPEQFGSCPVGTPCHQAQSRQHKEDGDCEDLGRREPVALRGECAPADIHRCVDPVGQQIRALVGKSPVWIHVHGYEMNRDQEGTGIRLCARGDEMGNRTRNAPVGWIEAFR